MVGEVFIEPLWPPVSIPNVPRWTNHVPWTIMALVLFNTASVLWVVAAVKAIVSGEDDQYSTLEAFAAYLFLVDSVR